MGIFNVIKNEKKYWLVDQVYQNDVEGAVYKQEFEQILADWERENVGYLSLLMSTEYHDWLLDLGLYKMSSIVEYTRGLSDLPAVDKDVHWHDLSEELITDEQFGELYVKCTNGTANKKAPQAKDPFFQSLEKELGSSWRKHCYYFIGDGAMIGIAIPHIEMGTKDEGRLFYFGVVPEWRGKGVGSQIHKLALRLLQKLGANSYVGSTDSSNIHMIRILQSNGCVLKDQKGMYRIEQSCQSFK